MRLGHLVTRPVPDYDLVLFSPGVRRGEVPPHLLESMHLFATWAETVSYLESRHGSKASAAVFPSATTQLITRTR
jgi:hypothetical protein